MTADSQVATLSAEAITIEERTPFQIVLNRFKRHRLAMVASIVMLAIFGITIFAPVIAPFKIQELSVNKYFAPWGTVDEETGRTHYMGTDNIGRDYFSRLIYAGRISLTVAILSVIIAETIGITVGAISGFFGGWVDAVLMRFVEFMLTIPTLPLLLIISSMLLRNDELINIPDPILQFMGNILLLSPRDSRNAVLIVLVLAGFGWLSAAQLMRGTVLSLREQTFVEASRSLGASNFRIIMRDMIPNAMAPIIVDASLGLAGYIVGEAALCLSGFRNSRPCSNLGQSAVCLATVHARPPLAASCAGFANFYLFARFQLHRRRFARRA